MTINANFFNRSFNPRRPDNPPGLYTRRRWRGRFSEGFLLRRSNDLHPYRRGQRRVCDRPGVQAAAAVAISVIFGLVMVAVGAPGGALWSATKCMKAREVA
jgi:hypothetical protein